MATRTLVLVRHAKARKRTGTLLSRIDLARPLTKRGRKDARRLGKRLAQRSFCPDLVWTSPSERTHSTARILAKQLRYKRSAITIEPRLYRATARTLAQLLRGLNPALSRVLVCGHNPALQSFAQRLGSELEELPTGGMVELQFAASSWAEAGKPSLTQATVNFPSRS